MKKLITLLFLALTIISCNTDDCEEHCTQEVIILFGRQRNSDPVQFNECNVEVTMYQEISLEDNGETITIGCECEPPFIWFDPVNGTEWLFDDPENPYYGE